MLRLSSGVLVVPPFECAWLTGDGYTLRNGSGCISFEAKGDTDATVILKSTPGAKRLQPLRQTAAPGAPGQPGGNALQVEENYTIIFGSHRNSCLKIEKNGVTQCMVPGVPCSRVSNKVFSKFWIDLNHGVLTIGHGEPGEGVCHQWRDAQEIPGIQHIGLSCWDRHVSYRSIALHPALDFTRLQQQQASRPAPGSGGPVPPLFDATVSAIMAATTPANVCNTLHVAELLLPTTQKLYRYSLDFIARHFRTVARDHPDALLAVSPAAMVDLVCQNTFSVDEHEIFAAVRDWACAHLAARGMWVGGGRPAEGQVQQRLGEEVGEEDENEGQRHRGVGEQLHAVRLDEEDTAGGEEDKADERQRVPDPDRETAGTEPGLPAARKGLHIGTDGVGGRDMGPPTPPQTQVGSSPRPPSSPHCTVPGKQPEGGTAITAGTSGADAAAGLWAWADASPAPEGTSRATSAPQLPALPPQLTHPPAAATTAAAVPPLPPNWAQTGRASLDCRAPDPLLPPGAVRPPSLHPATAARTCSLTTPAPPYHQGTSPGSPRCASLKHVASCSSLPEEEEDAEALEAACRVLGLIRFPLLPIDHLHACLADPLLSRLPHHRVMALVHEALEVHARETGAGAWPQPPLPSAAASAASRPGGGPGAAAGAGTAVSVPAVSELVASLPDAGRQGSGGAVGASSSRSSSCCLSSAGPSGHVGDSAGGASTSTPTAGAAPAAGAPFAAASTSSTTPSGAAPSHPAGASASSASPTPGRSASGPLVDPGGPWSGAVRYQRRCLPFALELMYVCDGDSCGVLHFLGTQYGSQGWVNPMLAKRVDVRASSPTGRTTDPRVIAGRQFVRTNFAGPRYVNGAASSWWMVDLGAQHRLGITYYTLRHDGSNDYARSWVLQGSSDLTTWVDLKRHANDTTIKVPGQYASWPVIGPAAAVPYRAFRLLLTGPNASPNPATRNTFSLSNLELYGYLSKGGSGGEEGVEGGGPGPGSAGGSGRGGGA